MIIVNDFNRKEVIILSQKLRFLAEDVGLTDTEVETLIGIRCGAWPLSKSMSDMWIPSKTQERRLRMLVEVCTHVIGLMGANAKRWMRRMNGGLGISPARFMLEEACALPALRDALRAEIART
jgi:hypothetical protein